MVKVTEEQKQLIYKRDELIHERIQMFLLDAEKDLIKFNDLTKNILEINKILGI